MAKLVVETVDKQLPGSEQYNVAYKRGDVIVSLPDDHVFGTEELIHPTWTIALVEGEDPDRYAEMTAPLFVPDPQTNDVPVMAIRRNLYYDLDTAAGAVLLRSNPVDPFVIVQDPAVLDTFKKPRPFTATGGPLDRLVRR